GEKKNLFVVGDDDQSIYRFRGAKPEIMLRFREDFPKADMVLLNINYRSSASIVAGALNLIGHNKERFGKQIRAKRQQGGGIEYAVFENQREQNLRIVRDLQKIMEQGGSLLECAILFRTNTQPRGLMEQLMEYNIPFYTRDSIPNLYEHWIAKDLFAYIRIAQGSRARSDFLKIMNRPKRYISRDSLDEDTVAFDVWEWYYEEQPWVAKRIGKLAQDIKALGRMSPYAAINYIRKGIGYDDFCEEYADYRRMKVEDLYEVLEELQTGAKAYVTFDAWFSHIEEYTKELEALSRSRQEQKEGVVLSTLHSAKGLEYETVYMIDVNEGLMPYKKAILPQDIEEERRMFYVGMTRAKKNLHLFSVKLLNNKDAEISRFIAESKETFTPLTN
ncbi:MAG: ATP-dependent helicase, partial [Roseburia sp.]